MPCTATLFQWTEKEDTKAHETRSGRTRCSGRRPSETRDQAYVTRIEVEMAVVSSYSTDTYSLLYICMYTKYGLAAAVVVCCVALVAQNVAVPNSDHRMALEDRFLAIRNAAWHHPTEPSTLPIKKISQSVRCNLTSFSFLPASVRRPMRFYLCTSSATERSKRQVSSIQGVYTSSSEHLECDASTGPNEFHRESARTQRYLDLQFLRATHLTADSPNFPVRAHL